MHAPARSMRAPSCGGRVGWLRTWHAPPPLGAQPRPAYGTRGAPATPGRGVSYCEPATALLGVHDPAVAHGQPARRPQRGAAAPAARRRGVVGSPPHLVNPPRSCVHDPTSSPLCLWTREPTIRDFAAEAPTPIHTRTHSHHRRSFIPRPSAQCTHIRTHTTSPAGIYATCTHAQHHARTARRTPHARTHARQPGSMSYPQVRSSNRLAARRC